jgi:hypothetical protein
MRWLIVPSLLLLVPCCTALATAQAPARPEAAANAAVQYWQAFAFMPTLDKDQEKLLADWDKVPLDAAAQKLLAASHNSLMYLHRGAKLKHCDWGLEYDDGISLLLPHLAKARDLARLAALHARHEFERGNKGALRDDATAIMTLGRHVGRDPVMICGLVRILIEGIAIDLVAPYVPAMKAPHAQALATFEALPPAATFQQTILFEKKYFAGWMIRKLKEEEAKKKGAGLILWRKFMDSPETPDVLKQIDSIEEVLRQMEEVLPNYDELARLVALPKAEFDKQYESFTKEAPPGDVLLGALLPAVDKVLAKDHRNQARMAMLLAAIAVAEGGPEKLKDIRDPFGTGPFEYRALDRGFELKSMLIYEGQPVPLTVGQQKKE